jgi:uncharacterized protein YndB with AHSA1/START domain
MGPVRAEIDVDASRARAFELIADLALRPAFTDHFVSDFRLLGVNSTGVGAGARFRFFAPPKAVWMDSAITELDPPHRMVERGHGGRGNRIPSITLWEVEPGPGGLTRVRVVYATEPAGPIERVKEAIGLAAHWYERDWAIALRRLRDLLESGAPLPPRAGVAGASPRTLSGARPALAAHE